MSEHRLSQAEIDMLLGVSSSSSEDENGLRPMEMDTIGEVCSIAMGAAATSLGQLLSRSASITNPRVSEITFEQYCQESPTVCYITLLDLQEGINGNILMAFQDFDARLIVDLLFGNDGSKPPEELGEMELSALTEAANQIAGNMMTSLSTLLKRKVVSGPTNVLKYDLSHSQVPESYALDDKLAKAVFRFELGELSDSVLTLLLPLNVAKSMVHAFEEATMPVPTNPPATSKPATASTPSRDTAASAAPPMAAQQSYPPQTAPQYPQYPPQGYAVPDPGAGGYAPPQYSGGQAAAINAQPVQFQPFPQGSYVGQPGNLGLILDVPLQVTVELGRTKRQVREVLDLGAGSIIELDKLTGDPVDILVNGKPIAEGEVVIIDENFAVRITKIKNVSDRLSALQ